MESILNLAQGFTHRNQPLFPSDKIQFFRSLIRQRTIDWLSASSLDPVISSLESLTSLLDVVQNVLSYAVLIRIASHVVRPFMNRYGLIAIAVATYFAYARLQKVWPQITAASEKLGQFITLVPLLSGPLKTYAVQFVDALKESNPELHQMM